jgi:hypothetical protein
MKNASSKEDSDDLRPEYDLSKLKGGVRGKYFSQSRHASRSTPLELNAKEDTTHPKSFPPRGVAPPDRILMSTCREYLSVDFQTSTDIQELIQLMFDEPECEFFCFKKDATPLNLLLIDAEQAGQITMNTFEDYYYLRPKTERSFVRISPYQADKYADRVETIIEGTRCGRITLGLTARTKRLLEARQIAHAQKN